MTSVSLLRNIESRLYQQTIYSEAVKQNTLVVLPTGLGKTVIIAYLIAHYLKRTDDGLLLVSTPTKPLVHQTVNRLQEFIAVPAEIIVGVSGSISPEKRKKIYENVRVVVGTPQTLNNDLLANRINPRIVWFVALDEAHRATGNYAYVGIVQQLPESVHIVGFTATPGNTKEQVLEVIQNIRAEHIIVKDESDPDVRPYVTIHKPERIYIDLPSEYQQALKILERYRKDLFRQIEKIMEEHELDDQLIKDILRQNSSSRRSALELHHQVIQNMKEYPEWGNLLTSTANLIRVTHLQDLIETQGLPQARVWLYAQQKKSKSKALQEFFDHPEIIKLVRILEDQATPHPKLQRLKKLIAEHLIPSESKIIIFSNYRDTVEFLHQELVKQGYNVAKFMGQAARNEQKGMSQKEQVAILEEFQMGSVDMLISTSVGEEGLDVGNCDLVVFYDSVPSVIRSIQRTGRGRKRKSRVVHLIAKGTRDVGMYYSTKNKGKKIKLFLKVDLPRILKSRKRETNTRDLHQWFESSDANHQTFKDSDESGGSVINQSNRRMTSRDPIFRQQAPSVITSSSKINFENLEGAMNETFPSSSPREDTTSASRNSRPKIDARVPMEDESLGLPSPGGNLKIIIDARESASMVPRLLKRRGIDIKMQNLEVGDYLIPPSVLVERKSYGDFAASIYDGRLFSQAVELVNQEEIDHCFLIIESERKMGASLRMEAEHGAILSLLLDFDIHVIFSHTPAETVDYLIALARRFQEVRRGKVKVPVRSTAALTLREIRELMLLQISGINKTKARKILDHFQTLEGVFRASREDLEQVEGIGKILADRIYQVLHGKEN